MNESLYKIDYYTFCMMKTVCPYVKNYYRTLIRREARKLQSCKRHRESQKQFTLEELSKYNGANGMPAYAAVDGTVYDFSMVPAWGGGTHFGLYAGKDLTKEFNACHEGGAKILEGIPKVGVIK
ncbi:cytochrome b5 domain-containing protein [Clostridium hydrogenum]|uniref:cytochrome b5 domain-containing protein n=1 Tax=Clostridium hydrogenum TaxID=2855764 RepID=UPI001F237FC7|nr:cytochrome b5 domain-containing protein [Clostridium hydrogenum]